MRHITIEFSDEEYYKLLIYAVLNDRDSRVEAVCKDLVNMGLKDFDHESIDILPPLQRASQQLKLLIQIFDKRNGRKKDNG